MKVIARRFDVMDRRHVALGSIYHDNVARCTYLIASRSHSHDKT